MRSSLLIIVTLTLITAACTKQPAAVDPERFLRPYVFGDNAICASNQNCTSGICYYGMCMGVLMSGNDWMLEAIAHKVKKDAAGRTALLAAVVKSVEQMLSPEAVFSDLKQGRLLKFLQLFDTTRALAVARRFLGCNEKEKVCSRYLKFISAKLLTKHGGDAEAAAYLTSAVTRYGPQVKAFLSDLPAFAPKPEDAL